MSNLVTLTQDEINRFGLEDKQVGDAITAEEYSKLAEKQKTSENTETEPAEPTKKSSKK